MHGAQEFHYRLPGRTGGWRPGAHPGTAFGTGQEFVAHMRLFDRPDPRRLDLRASLRDVREDWLVRAHRQRVGVAVHAIVDVSASMGFGARRSKLEVSADFIEALGLSAFRAGDALGLLAFDARERTDLFLPALRGRGIGSVMAGLLRGCACTAAGSAGVEQVVRHLAGRQGLVFLVSDFHWPLERLAATLDVLAHAWVVPMIVWDPAEIAPPEGDALAALRDAETGARRTIWLRPRVRAQWVAAVAQRRATLRQAFAARGLRPFEMSGRFDGEAMSTYFFEAAA